MGPISDADYTGSEINVMLCYPNYAIKVFSDQNIPGAKLIVCFAIQTMRTYYNDA
jgi:hypothetical protein